MTYLITVLAFAVKLEVLAHFSSELVHVGSRRSEVVVKTQVLQVRSERLAPAALVIHP